MIQIHESPAAIYLLAGFLIALIVGYFIVIKWAIRSNRAKPDGHPKLGKTVERKLSLDYENQYWPDRDA